MKLDDNKFRLNYLGILVVNSILGQWNMSAEYSFLNKF
jgi:hypothetical protein